MFFLFSCSDTSETEVLETSNSENLHHAYRFVDNVSQLLPFNPANKFDYVGALHYELYKDFYAQVKDTLSLSQVALKVQQLANQQTEFVNHFGPTYCFTELEGVLSLLSCESSCVETVLSSSSLSVVAQEKMEIFFSNFNLLFEKNTTSEALLDYIYLFEEEVIYSTDFTTFDRSVILSTTSIARFSTYESKRRPKKNTDPEWDSLITNLLGTIVGAEQSIEDGLVASLICGIQTN